MNKTVKLIALVAFIVFASFNSVQAQQKFGHVNFAQVYGLMPGQDSIKKVYETYAKGLPI